MPKHLEEVVKRFLQYSFGPVGYDYDGLTGTEQSLCTREEFAELAQWARGAEVPGGRTLDELEIARA